MNWLRVDSAIRDHPKCRKLGIILSKERAHSYVIDLWGWAARYCQDGDLSEVSALDIALACGWDDQPEKLLDALVKCRFVDRDGDVMVIHDWPEHQGKLIERASLSAQRSRDWRERIRGSRTNALQTNTEHTENVTIRTDVRTNERTNETNEEVFLVFPCSGPVKEWGLTTDYLDELIKTYPSLEVKAHMMQAAAWAEANEPKRKTSKGMKRFLVGWLNRAYQRKEGEKKSKQPDNFTGSSAPNRPCQYCGKPYPCKCYEEVERG